MMTAFSASTRAFPFVAVPLWVSASADAAPSFGLNAQSHAHGGPGYRRISVYRDGRMEVHTLAWNQGGESPLHGHGDSTAVYWVTAGLLQEERYLPDGAGYRHESVLLKPGDRSLLPPHSYHQVRALGATYSLHWYYPPPAASIQLPTPEILALLDAARRRSSAA